MSNHIDPADAGKNQTIEQWQFEYERRRELQAEIVRHDATIEELHAARRLSQSAEQRTAINQDIARTVKMQKEARAALDLHSRQREQRAAQQRISMQGLLMRVHIAGLIPSGEGRTEK